MRIDDFIVLGRTVPEASQRYGKRVCMAGYSAELGTLLRVYPLTIDNPLRSRHQATLELTRNPQDARRESYKLRDAVNAIHHVSSTAIWATANVVELATTIQTSSIAALNRAQRSLGFVAIDGTPTLTWHRKDSLPHDQLTLFEEFLGDLRTTQFLTGSHYPLIPYVTFRDAEQWHTLQLREWGTFEYLRKHDFQGEGLASALGLDHPQHHWYALVGNMGHRRNVWLVIQLFHQRQGAACGVTSDQGGLPGRQQLALFAG